MLHCVWRIVRRRVGSWVRTASWVRRKREGVVLALVNLIACMVYSPALGSDTPKSPIRHLIIVVGENHSFDNLFGAYQPAQGQTVLNLLSERIINSDGTPGLNFDKAQQWQ